MHLVQPVFFADEVRLIGVADRSELSLRIAFLAPGLHPTGAPAPRSFPNLRGREVQLVPDLYAVLDGPGDRATVSINL